MHRQTQAILASAIALLVAFACGRRSDILESQSVFDGRVRAALPCQPKVRGSHKKGAVQAAMCHGRRVHVTVLFFEGVKPGAFDLSRGAEGVVRQLRSELERKGAVNIEHEVRESKHQALPAYRVTVSTTRQSEPWLIQALLVSDATDAWGIQVLYDPSDDLAASQAASILSSFTISLSGRGPTADT